MLRDPFQQHEASPPRTPPLPAMTDGDANEAFMADLLDQSCILDGQDLPMPNDLCAAVARGCMLSVFDILAKWRTSDFLQNQTGGEIHASLTASALRLAMVLGRADIVSLLVAVPNGGYQYETAFSCAAGSGSMEVIEMFLDRGADTCASWPCFVLRYRATQESSGDNESVAEQRRGPKPPPLRWDTVVHGCTSSKSGLAG